MSEATKNHNKIIHKWMDAANSIDSRFLFAVTVNEHGRMAILSADSISENDIANYLQALEKSVRRQAFHKEIKKFDNNKNG